MSEQTNRNAVGECNPENAGHQKDSRLRSGASVEAPRRRKGSRKAHVPRSILEKAAEALMRDIIHRAKAGDSVALRLSLDFLSKRIEQPIEFELPPIEKPRDAIAVLSRITEGVGRSELTACEADTLVSLVQTWIKAIDVFDFDARLTALEERADHEKTA